MDHIKTYTTYKVPFYIFGSENSQDYDIIVSVDSIPSNIETAANLCKHWNIELSKILVDKPLNCNLGVFKNDSLIDCFKGTVDELINCIFYTYKNHKQFYPNPIASPIKRDVDEKILRVSRFIITFYSRTQLRPQIKLALRSGLDFKLNVLKKIDFTTMVDFPGKKESKEDIYKVLAFQFGQIFSLIDGHEEDSYTKNGISKNYPDLKSFLNRESSLDLAILNKYLARFITLIETKIKNNIKLRENEKSSI